MMKKFVGGLFFLMVAGILTSSGQNDSSAVSLRIGDPAPKLTIEKWLKGTPQNNLNDGKVRVIEFWATWCGPCILGMPHMSNLAKKYKEVPFVGVDASERSIRGEIKVKVTGEPDYELAKMLLTKSLECSAPD